MMKSCKYCGRIHDMNFICPKKPERRYRKKESGEIESYRNTNRRKEIHNRVRMRDLYLCRVCMDGKYGDYRDILGLRPKLEVHHIVPVAEDFERRYDINNLITLCRLHHEAAEAGEIDKEYLFGLAKNEISFRR